jgi:hypothetical protein
MPPLAASLLVQRSSHPLESVEQIRQRPGSDAVAVVDDAATIEVRLLLQCDAHRSPVGTVLDMTDTGLLTALDVQLVAFVPG